MKTGPELIQMSEITDKGIKNSYHSYSLIIKKNKEKYRVYKNRLNQAEEGIHKCSGIHPIRAVNKRKKGKRVKII